MDSSHLLILAKSRHILMLVVMAGLTTVACGVSPPTPRRGEQLRATCPPVGDADYFFPEGSLRPADVERDHDLRLEVSNYLSASASSSLSCGPGSDSYRVVWGGGYNEPLLIVTANPRTATAVEFLPFNVAKRSIRATNSKPISRTQFAELHALFEVANFWSAPSALVFESEGSGWRFEGRIGESYRVITRTHPDERLAEAGRLLVRLSGTDVPTRMASPIK